MARLLLILINPERWVCPRNATSECHLYLADDLGYGELGSYGQALIKTPNLDRLANHGDTVHTAL